MIGKIIKLSENGWGFITSPEKPFTRIFFFWSGLEQSTLNFTELKKDMKVEFELIEYKERGPRAIHIRVIDEPVTNEVQLEMPEARIEPIKTE